MARQRIKLHVYVDLDPTPGMFHTVESVRDAVQDILMYRISHYNPEVTLAYGIQHDNTSQDLHTL